MEQRETFGLLRVAAASPRLRRVTYGNRGGKIMGEPTTVLNDDSLYERYCKPLEQDHYGKYIAISQDGQMIVEADDMIVISQAIERFGSGNFMFHRIGYSYVWKVRVGHVGQL